MTDQELAYIEDRFANGGFSNRDFEKLIKAVRGARAALRQNMEWIGPPPADRDSFDSLREDAWAAGRKVLGFEP